MIQNQLTTEQIRKKFKNNFDLCNFAINIGRNMILSGTPATLDEILEAIYIRATELNQNALT
jgi:hypothetical protein